MVNLKRFGLTTLAVLVLFLPGLAFAQYADQGAAYAACEAKRPTITDSPIPPRCDGPELTAAGTALAYVLRYQTWYRENRAQSFTYPKTGKSCADRANVESAYVFEDGSLTCENGCQTIWVSAGYSSSLGGTTGQTCKPNDACPSGYIKNLVSPFECVPIPPDRDGDGHIDDDDAFPDDPGEHSDRDNDGSGDNSDPAPDDPGVGNGDDIGNPDNPTDPGPGEDDPSDPDPQDPTQPGTPVNNEFLGGKLDQIIKNTGDTLIHVGELERLSLINHPGTCYTPPACAGDSVFCAELRLQKAIDCRNQQREQQNISDLSAITAQGNGLAGVTVASLYPTQAPASYNAGRYGIQSSCPTLPSVEFNGVMLGPPPGFCDYVAMIRWMIVLFASLSALYIVSD